MSSADPPSHVPNLSLSQSVDYQPLSFSTEDSHNTLPLPAVKPKRQKSFHLPSLATKSLGGRLPGEAKSAFPAPRHAVLKKNLPYTSSSISSSNTSIKQGIKQRPKENSHTKGQSGYSYNGLQNLNDRELDPDSGSEQDDEATLANFFPIHSNNNNMSPPRHSTDSEGEGTDKFAFIPDHLWAGGKERRARPRQPFGIKDKARSLLGYLPDWIVTILLFAAFGALDLIDGFRREFSLTDTSIQHTFATKERVPFWAAIVIAGAFPWVVILFVAFVMMRNFWDAHNGSLGLFLSWAITTSITTVVKVTVGRPRPDLIDRCQPIVNAIASLPEFTLATSAICTRTDLLKDGFRSFPSGHSSGSFCGLGFLSFYLAGKFSLFDRKGHAIKAWISVIPLFGAAYIAISRTEDYRHHATDVLAGSFLGLVVAYLSYRLYYPSLYEKNCHIPYSPRHTKRVRRSGTDEEMRMGGIGGVIQDYDITRNRYDIPESTHPRPGPGIEASDDASSSGIALG